MLAAVPLSRPNVVTSHHFWLQKSKMEMVKMASMRLQNASPQTNGWYHGSYVNCSFYSLWSQRPQILIRCSLMIQSVHFLKYTDPFSRPCTKEKHVRNLDFHSPSLPAPIIYSVIVLTTCLVLLILVNWPSYSIIFAHHIGYDRPQAIISCNSTCSVSQGTGGPWSPNI